MSDRCLFSAPFTFLPPTVIEAYEALMTTDFREIWSRDELEPDSSLTVWLMNPGQNFIIDDGVLELYPSLKVLVTPSTGRNHISEAACKRRNLPVYSLLDDRETLDSITASSEFTFLLLLNALRRLDVGMAEVSAGRWRQRESLMRGRELAGKQVGLVGLGRIGRRLARYCRAFDADVAYYDPYVLTEDLPVWSLEEIFSQADAVCICCALTPETTGMISGDLLRRLKPEATLINSSRGEVVVEADLVEVLADRSDLRVGLDVLPGEVTNTHHESPLLEFHRSGQIVVTPHIAGASVESQSKAALGALNIIRNHFRSSINANLTAT
jgi:D-3-phosphoglycerate dehydrogenase